MPRRRRLDVDLFPGTITDVADVQGTRAWIEVRAIWIAQPLAPQLRRRRGVLVHQVAAGQRVWKIGGWRRIDAQHAAAQAGHVLPAVPALGAARRRRETAAVTDAD